MSTTIKLSNGETYTTGSEWWLDNHMLEMVVRSAESYCMEMVKGLQYGHFVEHAADKGVKYSQYKHPLLFLQYVLKWIRGNSEFEGLSLHNSPSEIESITYSQYTTDIPKLLRRVTLADCISVSKATA